MKSCQGQTGVKVLSHNHFVKITSSPLKRQLAFLSKTGKSSCIDLKTMMDISEHGNLSTSGQLHWVINQRPSLYWFFLWTFFLLSPQHLATLWSSLRFTKCRRFIRQQNVCSAAWLWLIFVLPLLFSRFLLLKSQVETGIFLSCLWVSLPCSSVDFLLQQLLQLA